MPSSITDIYGNAFTYCDALVYSFSAHSTIPTLHSDDCFSDINLVAKIIVPDALYDEWIAATNWSTYADYIYKASEVE